MHRQEACRQKPFQSDSGLKKMGPVLGPLHHFGLEGWDWPMDMRARLLRKVLEFKERWSSWSQLNRSHPGLEHNLLWTSSQLWLLLFWALEARAESEAVPVGSEAESILCNKCYSKTHPHAWSKMPCPKRKLWLFLLRGVSSEAAHRGDPVTVECSISNWHFWFSIMVTKISWAGGIGFLTLEGWSLSYLSDHPLIGGGMFMQQNGGWLGKLS